MKIRTLTVGALAGGALALAAAAPALADTSGSVPGGSVKDTVHIVNDVDSGHHGYWARLNLHRSVTITPGDTDGSWTVRLHDQGTFATIGGTANSPREGNRVRGVKGTVTGDYTLTVDSATPPSTKNVGNRYDYACDVHGTGDRGTDCPGMPASTSDWPKLYFGPDAQITGGAYQWTYHTASCGGQTWTDASTNGDGTDADAGDITGCKPCPPSTSPSSSPSGSPSQSPSGGPTSPSASPSQSGSAAPSSSASAQPSLTPAGNGGGSGSLPVTGTSLGLIAGGALALLGGGAAVLVLTRRRRTQS
ncbi:hypothetical protein [Actinocatenispora comari]|uniref:Gram-positive cocci surface proteins LPxTG domain-containing protein n=1 Tax=Actinocatenispora comari TaxID=2807577 RepID=A0A8J4AL88_9ACTN|nr:hypothetical protein [Actinocatenispora comari]GIL31502.1 hypothetical protein NUM_67560 [Actinocatenispora comari]